MFFFFSSYLVYNIRENNFKELLTQDIQTVIAFSKDKTIDSMQSEKEPKLEALKFFDSYYYDNCNFKEVLTVNKDAEYTYYYITALSEFAADKHIYYEKSITEKKKLLENILIKFLTIGIMNYHLK